MSKYNNFGVNACREALCGALKVARLHCQRERLDHCVGW